jgi:hypothetical protein
MSELIEGNPLAEADALLRAFRAGQMAPETMLGALMGAQVGVLLADHPIMEDDRIVSWKPVTGANAAGAQFVLAFTDRDFMTNVSHTTGCTVGLMVTVDWLTSMLPPEHGLRFNDDGENALEWGHEGIAEFLATHPRG